MRLLTGGVITQIMPLGNELQLLLKGGGWAYFGEALILCSYLLSR